MGVASATTEHPARFSQVDSMRGLAALSVVFFHVTFAFGTPSSTLGQYLSQRNAGPPINAVVVFFLISGFVLYRPFVAARFTGGPAPASFAYAVRRIARIVPAYWVALLIVTIWLGLDEVQSVKGVIRYFGFLQVYGTYHTASSGIGAAWTLCVEVTFYATVPIIAYAMRRLTRNRDVLRSELTMCAALWCFSIAWQILAVKVLFKNEELTGLMPLPAELDFFAAGMALAILSAAVAHRGPGLAPAWVRAVDRAPWACWLLAGVAFYGVGKAPDLAKHGFLEWWLPSHELKLIAAALLLLPLTVGLSQRGLLRKVLNSAPLVWLGTISYGVYLWHQALAQKIEPHFLGHSHGQPISAIVTAVAAIVVGAVSFYVIERPAQRAARNWLRGRREQRTARAAAAQGTA